MPCAQLCVCHSLVNPGKVLHLHHRHPGVWILDERFRRQIAIEFVSGVGFPALYIVGSYGNKPEPIPFLRILAVSDREDLRGE